MAGSIEAATEAGQVSAGHSAPSGRSKPQEGAERQALLQPVGKGAKAEAAVAAQAVEADATQPASRQSPEQQTAYADRNTRSLNTKQSHVAKLQTGAERTPQPLEGVTPQSLPSEGKPSGGADSASQMQHVDLFQQLGPRPMQSLAAGALPRAPTAIPQPPSDTSQSQPVKDEALVVLRAHPKASGDVEDDTVTEAETRGPLHQVRDSAAAESGHFSDNSDSKSQLGVKRAKQSLPPTLAPVPEASVEAVLSPAKDKGRIEPLRRSLLPAVHPRFRSSPLRTPAVMQSLGALPDRAAGQHTGHSLAPGSSDVVISSSWDASAKQGSLQQRLQQAAAGLQERSGLHAISGSLGQRLQQAAADSHANAAGSQDEEAGLNGGHLRDAGPGMQGQQRRSMVLPSRPSSVRGTPLPSSAQRAPALDMQSVGVLLPGKLGCQHISPPWAERDFK